MKNNLLNFLIVILSSITLFSCGSKDEIQSEVAKTDLIGMQIPETNYKVNALSNISDFKILNQKFENGILTVVVETILQRDNSDDYTSRRVYVNGKMIYKKQGDSWEFVELQENRVDNHFPYLSLDIDKQKGHKHISRYKGQFGETVGFITLVITEEFDDNTVKGFFLFDKNLTSDLSGRFSDNYLVLDGDLYGRKLSIGLELEYQEETNRDVEHKLNEPGKSLAGQLILGNRGNDFMRLFYDESPFVFSDELELD